MNFKKYTIVMNSDKHEFENEVTRFLRSGYTLVGTPFLWSSVFGVSLCQAVALPDTGDQEMCGDS